MNMVSLLVATFQGAGEMGGERKTDGKPVESKVGYVVPRSEPSSPFRSFYLFKIEMQNFQNSSVSSQVPDYRQYQRSPRHVGFGTSQGSLPAQQTLQLW